MEKDRFVKKYKVIQNLLESQKTNRILFLAILVVTFLYMFFLNVKTPLIGMILCTPLSLGHQRQS